MENVRLTIDINKRARERSKAEASEIIQKSGTSASSAHYLVMGGADAIKKLKAEKEPEIKANSERLTKKYADEANTKLIAEQNEAIATIKTAVRTRFNNVIDIREEQINRSRIAPIRKSSLERLQTLRMLIDAGADISESDWTMWAEPFAGYYNEEKVFAGFAKMRGIDILLSSDPDKGNEKLEAFRKMGNLAIDYLDHPEDSITVLSFINDNPNSPLAELINDIDSDLVSIIRAEKYSILQRLKDAQQTAYDRNNVMLSVKIGSFIDKYSSELATPEELKESLYAEAEKYIEQGMNAVKE